MEAIKNHIEQLKEKIFETLIKFNTESASDQRQVYFAQLWQQIRKYSKDHLHYDVEEMGKEIFDVTKRIVNKIKIQDSKDVFFKCLNRALKREKTRYIQKFKSSVIRIPRKLINLEKEEDIIKTKERQFNRELTEKERLKYISIWNKIEYAKKVIDISLPNVDKDNSITINETSISNEKIEKMVEGIKYVFEEECINKTRDCYRTLFTIYCIRKKKYFGALDEVLDQKILEKWKKEGKLPKQSEVYKKYRESQKSNISDKSAEARSSNIIDELNDKINKYLKRKYPKLFP
ncbi:MAG: hypothetical protein FWD13_10210 [Treponema sp.]|nr:hypothetical protein [Treponema sp.]